MVNSSSAFRTFLTHDSQDSRRRPPAIARIGTRLHPSAGFTHITDHEPPPGNTILFGSNNTSRIVSQAVAPQSTPAQLSQTPSAVNHQPLLLHEPAIREESVHFQQDPIEVTWYSASSEKDRLTDFRIICRHLGRRSLQQISSGTHPLLQK